MDDAVPIFSAMLATALRGRVRPDARSFVDMFAPDGVMEFPYGLPGFDTIHGRDVLAQRLAAQGDTLEFVAMSTPTVYEVTDGRTVVLEFVGTLRSVATGEVSDHRLVSVITVVDGLISHYKDYTNPLELLGALRARPGCGRSSTDCERRDRRARPRRDVSFLLCLPVGWTLWVRRVAVPPDLATAPTDLAECSRRLRFGQPT